MNVYNNNGKNLLLENSNAFIDFLNLLDEALDKFESWFDIDKPLPIGEPDFVFKGRIPQEPSEPSVVINSLTERLKKARRLNKKHLESLAPTPLYPALIGFLLAQIINSNNIVDWDLNSSWSVTPNLEKECIYMLSEMVGYDPEKSIGNIVSNGTIANLTALLVARDKKYGEKIKYEGLFKLHKGVILTSASSHFSIDKSARILGLGEKNVIKVPVATKEDVENFLKDGTPFSLKPPRTIYEDVLNRLREKGVQIICAIPTAGTTVTGTMEPIKYLVEFRSEFGFHLHVDAAFGAYAKLIREEELENKMKGLNKADSITVDPHKWGYVPYPCGTILFKEKHDLDLLKYEVSYLKNVAPTLEGSRPGASAAACWIALKTLGWEGYRQLLNKCMDNAKYLVERLQEEGYQLLHEVDLFTVNFRIAVEGKRHSEINKLNRKLVKEINKRNNFRVGFLEDLAGIRIVENGKKYPVQGIKIVLMNPLITHELIEKLIDEIKEVTKRILS